MKKIYIFLAIFLLLATSRFLPHPPNFTSLIALSFYVPAILGFSYIPALLISFLITDLIIGFHSTVLFTWGSVLIISLLASRYFFNSILYRIGGALVGACIFFVLTNLGVWIAGDFYDHTFDDLIKCYTLAIPFFNHSLISTLLFSILFEGVIKIYEISSRLIKTNILEK
jgi:hypothetical protein